MTRWETPLCPFTIEFDPDRLDEIRLAVVDGFYAVPRGGLEIGGVLFGKVNQGNLLICDYRRIGTEYLTGPSFRLSDRDQAGLWALLTETRFKDPDIQPLGWFVSHTRSGIELLERDLDIYRRFFPELVHVVLVLKPDSRGKVRGGYFFREDNGSVKAEAAVSEFWVEPHWGEKQPPPEAFPVAVTEEPRIQEPPDEEAMEQSLIEQSLEDPPPTLADELLITPTSAEGEPFTSETVSQSGAWLRKKEIIFPVLMAASIAAAFAGYWVATH
jgi:hypothetical protein